MGRTRPAIAGFVIGAGISLVVGAAILSVVALLQSEQTKNIESSVNVCHRARECHVRLNRLLQAADPGEPILLGRVGAGLSIAPASPAEPRTIDVGPSVGRRVPRRAVGEPRTPRSSPRRSQRVPQQAPRQSTPPQSSPTPNPPPTPTTPAPPLPPLPPLPCPVELPVC